MRTFIAIEVPEEIKTAIAALQDDLRRARAEVSWTKPENIHLTLKFLGEIDEQLVSQVAQACLEAAQNAAPFTLSLSGTGVFPNARQPRVLWAGLSDEDEQARRLQSQLDERLAALGFEREARAFHPHLTIGRIKSPKGAQTLLARAIAYHLPALSFLAREIVLFRSQLHPAGAHYTPLSKAQFRIPASAA
jgi:2'-5' RNA ligase